MANGLLSLAAEILELHVSLLKYSQGVWIIRPISSPVGVRHKEDEEKEG